LALAGEPPVTKAFRAPRRAAKLAGVLTLSLGVSGCILTKDLPDPALDIPPSYQAAGGKRTDAPPKLDWWRGFGSRELTALMEEAQTVNLDIAAAAERIAQADAQARITGAALLPSLSGLASSTQLRSSSATSAAVGSTVGGTVIGSTAGREIRTYSTSLSASYEFDFWGKNRALALGAEETANAVRFDREVVALTTMAAVANAYFQVLASQDRIRTATSNIASAQRILDAIRARLAAGTGNELEVAQQESVLANQRAAVPPLRQTLATNINALALLVARPPESLSVSGGSLNKIAAPRVTPGLPSELLTQRPDIRRQEAYLASATANVGNARAQFFPSITLTGNAGYQSAALATLFTPQAVFYNVATSLTQPIFDGGRILGNFELTKARQEELLQTYRKTVISAFTDVDNALVAIRHQTERLRLQREVVAASQRAFNLAEQQLRAGTADIVTVLNTQLTLFQSQDVLSQVQLARLQAIVSLFQALGGGWEPRVERPVNAL
jgi:NodT family efflux transporter outer membrane factor (OMF) lipoprotein